MARKTGYFFNTHYSRHYSHYSEKYALLGTIIHYSKLSLHSKLSLLRVLILPLTGQLQILAARVGSGHLLAHGLHRLLMFLV